MSKPKTSYNTKFKAAWKEDSVNQMFSLFHSQHSVTLCIPRLRHIIMKDPTVHKAFKHFNLKVLKPFTEYLQSVYHRDIVIEQITKGRRELTHIKFHLRSEYKKPDPNKSPTYVLTKVTRNLADIKEIIEFPEFSEMFSFISKKLEKFDTSFENINDNSQNWSDEAERLAAAYDEHEVNEYLNENYKSIMEEKHEELQKLMEIIIELIEIKNNVQEHFSSVDSYVTDILLEFDEITPINRVEKERKKKYVDSKKRGPYKKTKLPAKSDDI